MTNTAGTTYADFAARLEATGIISDPWLWGEPRFRPEPVILGPAVKAGFDAAAEAVALACHHLALICAREPGHLDSFFELSPCQKLMALASLPLWHGIARADVFLTPEGPRVCELNSDTPSGEAEAVLLGRLAAEEHPGLWDPNTGLEARFGRMIEISARRLARAEGPISAGIVYPTEMTEDLSMVLLFRSWFEARGWEVTLGSPYNLTRLPDGRAALFDTPCDVIVRHYKTDWWGERMPVWNDAPPVPDSGPLDEPLSALLGAALDGKVAVINPFGSVVTQNKKSLAFFWERMDLFPPIVQQGIRHYVPRTLRRESIAGEILLAEKDRWVLKSDYGCEGEEVVIGRGCTLEEWQASLDHARPGRWVVQEYFEPLRDAEGRATNHGVYVVAGEASGIYARVHGGPTDSFALSAPVLIDPSKP